MKVLTLPVAPVVVPKPDVQVTFTAAEAKLLKMISEYEVTVPTSIKASSMCPSSFDKEPMRLFLIDLNKRLFCDAKVVSYPEQ